MNKILFYVLFYDWLVVVLTHKSKHFIVSLLNNIVRHMLISNGRSDASSVMAKCFVCLSPFDFIYNRWLAVMCKGETSA